VGRPRLPAESAPRRADAELLALVHSRANDVRGRRQRLRFAGVGAAAVLTLMAGIGAAAADTGNSVSRRLERAADTPPAAVATTLVTTTTTEAATTTTVAIAAPAVAPPAAPTTPTTASPVSRVTATASTSAPNSRPTVRALLTDVSSAHHDPGRIYVSAEGDVTGGYISRMILRWGDGSPPRIVDYQPSSCHTPGGAQPHGTQVTDDNHTYAAPGSYTVSLTVVATTCDGAASQTDAIAIPVTSSAGAT